MAGEIQIGGTTFATESGGTVTVSNVDSATNRTNLGLGSIATQASDSIDINGGAIDGTTIGGTSAAAGTFTTFTSTGIDDNASSTALTIDSSGNISIGSSVGHIKRSFVGVTESIAIGSGDTGIFAAPSLDAVVPFDIDTNATRDNAVDLGYSTIRWDDIYATNNVIQTSDENEKENITSSDLSLNFIKQLNPVSYRFIGKTRTHYGLIAQEIETLLSTIGKETTDFAGFIKSPKTDDDGNETGEYKYGLRYGEFISPMIKAIQEQQTIIESQQSQIDELTARIEALEATP